MGLNSTVVTLNNLFKLNFTGDFQSFLESPKTFFSIPDYQREYKWEKPKIKTFVSNVMQRSKFLGIITTEASNQPYLSIVDGQQRFTTIMLILAWLYNMCVDEGETETQKEILELITYKDEGRLYFKLENASIGEYLHLGTDNKIELEINPLEDIFKQKKQFDDAWNTVKSTASDIHIKHSDTTLDEYKQRLLDCEFLLFSQKNSDGLQQGSIEEIYIDINEKSQKLSPEDIFKGHCFAICKTEDQQRQVKELWRSAKKNFFSMENMFKQIDMDLFLHYYLLTQEATQTSRKDIKADLTIDGNNIISQRYNTPTKVINLIKDIDKYQTNLLTFEASLSSIQPAFRDIMTATAQELGNNRARLIEIQKIIKDILACKQNLFKLPLFYFIDLNMRKPSENKPSYAQVSGFLYLYYIYMFLFAKIHSSRKRGDLANNLIHKICSNQNILLQFIKEIKIYADNLDLDLDEKVFKDKFAREHFYQIIDFFNIESGVVPATNDNDLSIKMQFFPETYNLEHLIINKSQSLTWTFKQNNESNSAPNMLYNFSKEDFKTCQAWISSKNHWANFIWIDETFNREKLENKDIISKLILLRGDCDRQRPPANNTYAKKHIHIELICQHIMSTSGFDELYQIYQNGASREIVLDCYQKFVNNYFSEENTLKLTENFSKKLISMLNSLYKIIQ